MIWSCTIVVNVLSPTPSDQDYLQSGLKADRDTTKNRYRRKRMYKYPLNVIVYCADSPKPCIMASEGEFTPGDFENSVSIIDSVDDQFAFWKTGSAWERFVMGDFGTRAERFTARRGAAWPSILAAVLATVGSQWSRRLVRSGAFPFLLLAVVAHAAQPTQPAVPAPLITVLEVGQRIEISIPPSTTVKASVTFRVRSANANVKEISFLPTDLATVDGKRILRQKLSAAGGAIDAADKDFTLVVDGADTLGKFTGQLLVRSPQVPGVVQPIDVAITIAPASNPAFPPESSKLKLQIAESCDGYTRFVLGWTHCPGQFKLAYDAPASTAAPLVDLLLTDANNSAVTPTTPDNSATASVKDGRIVVDVRDHSLAPGHYSGRVQATFGASGEKIQAPIEIDVRVGAWLPTLLIVAGILVGRLQAMMASSGNAVLAASRRLDRIRVRTNGLWHEAQDALGATNAQIAEAVSARDIPLATQLLTKQEACLRALETAESLLESESYISNPQQFDAALQPILKAVRLADDAEAAKALKAFVEAVTAPQNQPKIAGVSGDDDATAKQRKQVGWIRRNAGWLRELFFLTLTQRLLFVILVGLLGAAGLGTLYISNGAIMGASPLADYAALFAWGLTADVASRTLANAKS